MPCIRLFCCPPEKRGGRSLRRWLGIERNIRTRVNFQIRVPEVRVLGSDGEQLGVMPTEKAINLALDEGLDLVEVSPTSRPPVCRIMDYGKYKYEKNKRAKISKKKQHVVHVKEIKLRPKTEEHDFQFKKKHALEFLEKHNKVKFTVFFRGREFDHQELGHRILARMREELSAVGVVEKAPQFEGRVMTMLVAPIPAKGGQRPKAPEAREAPTRQATPAERHAERPSQQGSIPDARETERED